MLHLWEVPIRVLVFRLVCAYHPIPCRKVPTRISYLNRALFELERKLKVSVTATAIPGIYYRNCVKTPSTRSSSIRSAMVKTRRSIPFPW